MSDEAMEARGVFAAACGVAGAAGSTTGVELTPAAEIRAYVDKVWPSFLDDLEALVVVPSVVDESCAAAGAPWGLECYRALCVAMDVLRRQGLAVVDCDGYVAYGELVGETPEQVATIAHVDVVPAGEGWTVEPYAVTRREGVLLGRGVLDDKGAALASIYAAGFLARRVRSGWKPQRTLRCILGASEESGMMDVRRYLVDHESPAFLFTPDAEFAVCCGEKGCVNAEVVHAVDSAGAIIEFAGGVARNAVPARAEALVHMGARMNGLPRAEGIDVEPVGGGVARIVAHGVAGHAAEPAGTVNAIGVLVAYLAACGICSAAEREFLGFCKRALGAWDGSGLGIDVADELFGGLTCIGGTVRTQAGRFVLTLDARLPGAADVERVSRRIEDVARECGCEVRITHTREPFTMDPQSPEVMVLRRAYEEFAGRPAVPFAIGGGTYAHHFPRAVGFGPLDRTEPLPDWVGPEHGPNEGIWEHQLKRALAIYIRSLESLLNSKVGTDSEFD